MNRVVKFAVPVFLIFLAKEALAEDRKGSDFIDKVLHGICMAESGCSSRYAYSYHPDGISYGLYGLTEEAVKDAGMNWEAVKRSTSLQKEAARRYLLKMYKVFGNWNLAIQAYHLGPGNVLKGKRDYNYLSRVKHYAGLL